MSEWPQQILDFAIAKEKAAQEFYLQWSKRVDDQEVSQLLTELASDERRHVETLTTITPEALISKGAALPDFKLSELITDVAVQPAMQLVDALVIAIQREEKAISLYDRLRRSSTNAEPLFAALAEEERRHKHRLELKYAKLKRHSSKG